MKGLNPTRAYSETFDEPNRWDEPDPHKALRGRVFGSGDAISRQGGRAHSPRGTAGSPKGPNPAPRRPCPYALVLLLHKTYP